MVLRTTAAALDTCCLMTIHENISMFYCSETVLSGDKSVEDAALKGIERPLSVVRQLFQAAHLLYVGSVIFAQVDFSRPFFFPPRHFSSLVQILAEKWALGRVVYL